MSQTNKVHKLTIKDRNPEDGKITTGAKLQVELDGKPLKGVKFLKFEAKAGNVVKVLMEMYVNLDVEVNVDSENLTTKKISKKPPGLFEQKQYELGELEQMNIRDWKKGQI